MPPIWCRVTFRGQRGEIESMALLNSGSDAVVLPKELASKIKPKPLGMIIIELADGRVLKRRAYEIEVEVMDEKGRRRKARACATIEPRDYPLIGTEAMEKLRVIPDVVRGKAVFLG